MVSVMLIAADILGANLSELLVLFWHRYWESAWNKLATATSAASHPSQTHCHSHSHLSFVVSMVLVTRRFQTAPLPICHSLQYLTWLQKSNWM